MTKRTIKAKFFDSCMLIVEGNRIFAKNVSYEYAKDMQKSYGGEVWQEFIDEDGYMGFVIRPYNCSDEE